MHSEERLRAVLETAVDAIITIDQHGIIRSANPATQRMLGYTQAELIGSNVSMIMPSPYRQEHDGYIQRYLRTGEKRIIGIGREVEARRKDGTIFPVDLAVSEVVPGELFTGVIRDISDRKLAESRLREADRMASIGALSAGLGHDMNNVLLPVRAHLNAASAQATEPAVREHLRSVQKSVAYLQQLADGLHFLAMDPDKEDDTGGSSDLHAWWAQAGALLSKSVPKHVKVTVSLPDDLPEVAIAAHALTQAVLNLIVNAGEAVPPNRKRRQGYVRLWAEQAGDEGAPQSRSIAMGEPSTVKLGVTDNGSGMSEEVKRRAFDMFFTTKTRGLGTGLGLALVRKVVDRAGGSVEIESAPGKGTSVVMNLPVFNRGEGDAEQLTAKVRIADGRAASLVRSLLEAAGVRSTTDGGDDAANICIAQPIAENLAGAKKWRIDRPQGPLVLFGRPNGPSAAAWRGLATVIIENPDDLDAVRSALTKTMATC